MIGFREQGLLRGAIRRTLLCVLAVTATVAIGLARLALLRPQERAAARSLLRQAVKAKGHRARHMVRHTTLDLGAGVASIFG
jgi:hypothetical protein